MTSRIFISVFVFVMTYSSHLAAAPTSTAFTFQGQLKDAGVPADGGFDMRFSLFDVAAGGVAAAGPLVHDGSAGNPPEVDVVNGLFNVQLDFGAVYDGTALWLHIEVRPHGVGGYTALTPRQPLTATPFALYALDGPGGSGPWSTNGADIYNNNAGNVGIGTNSPATSLHVFHPGSSTGEIQFSSPAGSPGIVGFANNGNRRDFRFTDTGLGLYARNSASMPIAGTGLFIEETGNVGIGTTSPQRKLHVAGSIQSDQAIYSAGPIAVNHTAPTEMVDVQGSILARTRILAGYPSYFFWADASTQRVGIGTSSPAVRLHVVGGTDAAPSGGGFVVTGPTNGLNISIDNNEIMARNNGAVSTLYLNADGGDISCGGPLVVGYQIVSAGGSAVSCPTGKKPIGGGCRINSGSAELTQSYPTASGWACQVGDQVGFISLSTYAICASVK